MKFCNKCGASLEDDAVFCSACGETQSQESVQNNVETQGFNMGEQEAYNSFGTMPEAPKKKSKKPLIIGLIAGAVALIAIIAVVLVFVLGGGKGSGSPEGITKEFMNAYKKFDGEAMMDCIAYSNDYKEEVEDMEEEFASLSSMASMMEIDYKINKIKKASSDEKSEFWEEAEDNDVLVDEDDVKDLRIATVTMTVSAFGMEEETEMSLYLGKYKGDWKVLYIAE